MTLNSRNVTLAEIKSFMAPYSELGRSLERSTIPSGIEGCLAGDSVLGRLVGLDVSKIVASPN